MRSDPVLQSLEQALDPDRMLPFVARAAGLHPDDVASFGCAPEVVMHKRGRRCAIRYDLSRSASPLTADTPPPVFGKMYGSRRRATRMFQQTEALRASGVPSIPACLMLVRPLRLVLQECVHGVDLGSLMTRSDAKRPLSLAAEWLVGLHGTPPLPGLKAVSPSHGLEKADRWCTEIGSLLGHEPPALTRARGVLLAASEAARSYAPAMIHRDYYYAHVLWNGARIWVVDFDELSVGDPALDVGHFLAQLEYEAYRRTRRPDAFTELGALFENRYREGSACDLRARLPFHRACTLLKLARKEASRQQGDWRQSVRVLVELAERPAEMR
jgi:aminoglycoside phosphotransferase (APT) family kinase protein